MEIRSTKEYWDERIEQDGIDAVEAIVSNDRTSTASGIESARTEAITSFRLADDFNKLKKPAFLVVFFACVAMFVYFIFG